MGDYLLYLRIGQDFEIDPLELFHRELVIDVAVQLRLDIPLLRFRYAGDIDILEDERRQGGFIGLATPVDLFQRDFTRDPLLDGINHRERTPIPDFHNLFRFGKIQQRHVREDKLRNHSLLFGDIIVCLLHNHRLQLVVRVLRRLLIGSRNDRAEDEVRMKRLLHRFDREIVVNTSIKQRHIVFPYRLEKERERHRGTNGFTQIPALENNRFLVINVRPDAAEGHEQIVEVPRRLCRCLCIERHKRLVHLDRINQALGQEVGLHLQRIGEVDREMGHLRRRVRLPEIIHIILLDRARLPIAKLFRQEQLQHLVRRIAHRIEAPDNRPDGGSGNIIDRNIVFFQRLDDPDVRRTLRAATAQHQTDLLRTARTQAQEKNTHNKRNPLHDRPPITFLLLKTLVKIGYILGFRMLLPAG